MVSLDERLRSVPFFSALPAHDLAAIAAELHPRAVRKGTVVFREGDEADAMYFVESGHLEVLRGSDRQPLALLGAGSVAGELGLLLGEPRSATLRAASACRLWRLAREDLDRLLDAHAAIALELSAELGRRLVTTTRRLTQGDISRFVVAFDAIAPALCTAVAAEGLRVGLINLQREVAAGDGVTMIPAKGVSAASLAAAASQRFHDLDVVVVGSARSAGPVARAAVDVSEWVVAAAAPPAWVAARHSPERTMVWRSDAAGALARQVTGRAVGLALSSGGSKTAAHVGVVGELLERGARIDAVAGSSGGAIVAAGMAAGMSIDDGHRIISELAAQLRPRHWDLHLVPRSGVIKGRRLRDLFDRWFEGRHIEDLEIPLYVVASDMLTGEEVVFDRGPLADALRASTSIPGAFDPWRHEGRVLIDGGVSNPLPAGPLRQAGFERIVASNVAGKDVDRSATAGTRLPSIINVMLRTVNLMEAEAIKAQLPLADVTVRPHVKASGSFDFTQIDAFIAEGRDAVVRQKDELRRFGIIRG